jgi:flagellar basal body-associated protein FliL
METPAWILVIMLSVTLFIFLVVGIILIVKLISVTKEAKKIVLQGQDIAEKADDIAGNVRDMTTVGGLVKHFAESYLEASDNKNEKKSKSKE